MSKYSTSSPQNETGLTEWETRMAKLVGLDESTPADMEYASTTDVNLQPQTDEPTSSVTQQSLSANPFAKAGLVGAGTLAVVMFAGGFLSQIMSNDNSKPTQKAVVRETPAQPTKPRMQQLEEEVEGLKTKLALSEQLEAVKAAQEKLRMVKPTPSTPRVAAKPTPQAKPRTIPRDLSMSMIRRRPEPPQIRTVYVPQPRPQPQKVSQPVAQKPKPTPVLPPIPPPPVAPPQPLVEIEPPPEPSPMQEWARLAKLGSYGQVSLGDNQTVSNRTSSEKEEVDREDEDEETPTKSEEETRTDTARSSVKSNPKTIPVGSRAKAVLATPIYGETTKSRRGDDDENENDNNNVYAVRLEQPLKAADGTTALPAGSQIFTKIDSISESGLMQLEIVNIKTRENGEIVEKSVPQNSLMIRGNKGKPLIAKQFRNNGSSIARRDAVLGLAGGINKAAELMNRTESEVVTGENGTVAVTNRNRNPSMAAGILEGATKAVVPQISRRNQRAISEMSRKSGVFYLSQGKEVEVFVNQETQL